MSESVSPHVPEQAPVAENALASHADQDVIKPRIWPAILIAVLQLAAIFGGAWIAPGTLAHFMGIMWGPIIGAALLVFWWLLASRVPWRDRLVGLLLVIAIFGVARFLIHDSMKLGLLFFVLPTVTTSMAGMLLVTPMVGWLKRRWLLVLAMALAAGLWTAVRVDGLDGNLSAEFSARWTTTGRSCGPATPRAS